MRTCGRVKFSTHLFDHAPSNFGTTSNILDGGVWSLATITRITFSKPFSRPCSSVLARQRTVPRFALAELHRRQKVSQPARGSRNTYLITYSSHRYPMKQYRLVASESVNTKRRKKESGARGRWRQSCFHAKFVPPKAFCNSFFALPCPWRFSYTVNSLRTIRASARTPVAPMTHRYSRVYR